MSHFLNALLRHTRRDDCSSCNSSTAAATAAVLVFALFLFRLPVVPCVPAHSFLLSVCPVNLSHRSSVVARRHPVVGLPLRINIFPAVLTGNRPRRQTDGMRARPSSVRCLAPGNPQPCISNPTESSYDCQSHGCDSMSD